MTVNNLKRRTRIAIPLILVALFAFASTRTAEAGYYGHHGYGRGYYGHGYGHHGYYGHGYYGRGYGHHGYYGYGRRYSPYYDSGGLDLGVARLAGLGALDLDVTPRRKTKVYLGGEYIGVVGSFDGYPSYLWLKEGTYQLVFYRDGYTTLARELTVHPGVVVDVELRMERGESVPPEEFLAGLIKDDAGNGLESS